MPKIKISRVIKAIINYTNYKIIIILQQIGSRKVVVVQKYTKKAETHIARVIYLPRVPIYIILINYIHKDKIKYANFKIKMIKFNYHINAYNV